jgi:thiol-disulfide isomerase/thioredoxin
MTIVTLYTRPGCGLCREAEETLRRLAARYPHTLRAIDISQDRELLARYHLIIPVVDIGETRLHAPLDAAALESALARAQSL